MARKKYSTTKQTSLSSAMSNVDTTVNLVDGSSYPDPTVGGNGPYTVLIGYQTSREEICTVTGKPSTNQLTVTRGQDGSSATSKNIGDLVVHGVSKRDWEELLQVDGSVAMTGELTLSGNPSGVLGATPKQYVDAADALKAPLASPAFTGNPTAPTPTAGDNDTSIATTAFVNAEIANDAVLKSGSTMTGALTLSGAPSSALHAATKGYVDDFKAREWYISYTGGTAPGGGYLYLPVSIDASGGSEVTCSGNDILLAAGYVYLIEACITTDAATPYTVTDYIMRNGSIQNHARVTLYSAVGFGAGGTVRGCVSNTIRAASATSAQLYVTPINASVSVFEGSSAVKVTLIGKV